VRHKYTLVYVLRGIQPPDEKVVLLSDVEDKATVAIGKHADVDFSHLATPLAIANDILNSLLRGQKEAGTVDQWLPQKLAAYSKETRDRFGDGPYLALEFTEEFQELKSFRDRFVHRGKQETSDIPVDRTRQLLVRLLTSVA
jgi:hypothetical protein